MKTPRPRRLVEELLGAFTSGMSATLPDPPACVPNAVESHEFLRSSIAPTPLRTRHQGQPSGAPHEAAVILLISDSHNDVLAARRILLEHGITHQIIVACTAAEALRLLRSSAHADQRASMILLNLRTPHLNGFDFAIHVRANPATRDLPIVVLATITADTPIRELLSGQEHPHDTAVPQPHTRQEFLTALQALGVSWQGHGLEKVMSDLARALGTGTLKLASDASTLPPTGVNAYPI